MFLPFFNPFFFSYPFVLCTIPLKHIANFYKSSNLWFLITVFSTFVFIIITYIGGFKLTFCYWFSLCPTSSFFFFPLEMFLIAVCFFFFSNQFLNTGFISVLKVLSHCLFKYCFLLILSLILSFLPAGMSMIQILETIQDILIPLCLLSSTLFFLLLPLCFNLEAFFQSIFCSLMSS